MKHRYVYQTNSDGTVEAIEVTSDYVGQRRDGGHRSEEEMYGHVTATDGTDLSTRRRHREYMKENNLTVMDDFRGQWAQAEKERERFFKGESDRRALRETIGQIAYRKGYR